jgi:hypothetical protein
VKTVEFGIDPLVVEYRLSDYPPGEPLDNGADPGRTETLVELAPAYDAVVGRQFEEVIVSPAGVAAKNFEALDLFHRRLTPLPEKRSIVAV